MEYIDFFIRLAVCFGLSFFIGLERQWRHRMVGLRTNVLVCLGSFLFVTTATNINGEEIIRMAASVVSGIGFLGAGVILRDGVNVKGLNTAATLWCTSAIGVLSASGLLIEAAVGTFFILTSNIILRIYAKRLMNKNKNKNQENYIIKIICKQEKELIIRTLLIQKLNRENIILSNIENIDINDNKIKIYANVITPPNSNKAIEKVVNRISIEPDITSVGWDLYETEKDIEDNDA